MIELVNATISSLLIFIAAPWIIYFFLLYPLLNWIKFYFFIDFVKYEFWNIQKNWWKRIRKYIRNKINITLFELKDNGISIKFYDSRVISAFKKNKEDDLKEFKISDYNYKNNKESFNLLKPFFKKEVFISYKEIYELIRIEKNISKITTWKIKYYKKIFWWKFPRSIFDYSTFLFETKEFIFNKNYASFLNFDSYIEKQFFIGKEWRKTLEENISFLSFKSNKERKNLKKSFKNQKDKIEKNGWQSFNNISSINEFYKESNTKFEIKSYAKKVILKKSVPEEKYNLFLQNSNYFIYLEKFFNYEKIGDGIKFWDLIINKDCEVIAILTTQKKNSIKRYLYKIPSSKFNNVFEFVNVGKIELKANEFVLIEEDNPSLKAINFGFNDLNSYKDIEDLNFQEKSFIFNSFYVNKDFSKMNDFFKDLDNILNFHST